MSNLIFAAGNVSGGKHLWIVDDNGSTLTLLNSFTLAGNVTALVVSAITERVYAAIGNYIYCYDYDGNLVTGWGSGGSVNVGAVVNDLAIDSSDYLAVAHVVVSSGRISLYDNTGTKLWTSTVWAAGIGRRADFDVAGNVVGCTLGNNSTSTIAALVKRVDGTLSKTYLGNVGVAGFNGNAIASSRSLANYCWYVFSYTSTYVCYSQGSGDIWTGGITGTNAKDCLHLSGVNLVIVADGQNLRKYDDITGNNPGSVDIGTAILNLASNNSNEIICAGNNGYLYIYNSSLVQQRNLSVSSVALNVIAVVVSPYVAPEITDQSTDTTVDIGDSVSLFITATGTPSPTYQWYKDGDLLPGETNDTLEFTATSDDVGTYTCVATNIAGDDTSDPIILGVLPGKPVNPTPSHLETDVIISWPTIVWESGS